MLKERQDFTFLVSYWWRDGLRWGFGHQVIGAGQPPLTQGQFDELAAKLAELRGAEEVAVVGCQLLRAVVPQQPKIVVPQLKVQ